MTVRSSSAKKRIVVRRRSGESSSLSAPNKPKVTVGPKAYGRTKSGKPVVVRFFVSQLARFKKIEDNAPWFVIDFEDGKIAKGTKADGYRSKENAIKVARQYRDEFGAYARSPF